jgi:hypothetical protein
MRRLLCLTIWLYKVGYLFSSRNVLIYIKIWTEAFEISVIRLKANMWYN